MTGTEVAAEENHPGTSINRDATEANVIVVMGVSGTGKTTLGRALARARAFPFVDADDLHPAANVAKMARGEALGDADRWAWLARVREAALGEALRRGEDGGRAGVIVACSALKKAYRAVLRGAPETRTQTQTQWTLDAPPAVSTYFVFLEGERDVLMARMLRRQGHFMKADMLASQLETLESPVGEPGVVTVTVDMSTEEQVRRVVEAFGWA